MERVDRYIGTLFSFNVPVTGCRKEILKSHWNDYYGIRENTENIVASNASSKIGITFTLSAAISVSNIHFICNFCLIFFGASILTASLNKKNKSPLFRLYEGSFILIIYLFSLLWPRQGPNSDILFCFKHLDNLSVITRGYSS
jgi:hypothetical protein